MNLTQKLAGASEKRNSLLGIWHEEGTDCYRLFHGAVEGRPGLSVDRYGSLTVAQVAGSSPLTADEQKELETYLKESCGGRPGVIAIRDGTKLVFSWESSPGAFEPTYWCRELGLEFAIDLTKAHRDPQLFLDFRAAKRRLAAEIKRGNSVLNLFAYTCTVGCHAVRAAGTTAEIWNADFSAGNLSWGEKNYRRNRLFSANTKFVEEDCVGLLWRITGNKEALNRKHTRHIKVSSKSFDVVVADPPVWAKGKFAAVDLIRDPETVFRPAWLAVAPGGLLVATNNSAKVTRAEFSARLEKMLKKAAPAHELASLEWVEPDDDFPSHDGEHPLKVAFCRKV